jgi:hypothetical protein
MKKLVYRNKKYLEWARLRKCLVTGKQAEVAHHVRDRDNSSGIGLRPSDYRVLPLLNSYHTTGTYAVHRIGALSFYQRFGIDPHRSIVSLLKEYLKEVYGVEVPVTQGMEDGELIPLLEEKIENLRPPEEIIQEKAQKDQRKEAIRESKRSPIVVKLPQPTEEQKDRQREWAKGMRTLQKDKLKNSKEHQSYLERVKKELSRRRKELYQKLKSQSAK